MNTLKQYSRRSDDDGARQLKIEQTRVKQMETKDHQISSAIPPPPSNHPSRKGRGGEGVGGGGGGRKKGVPRVGGHRRPMAADSMGSEVSEATRGGGVAVSRCRCGKQERDPLPLHYVLLALIQHGWSRLPSMATFKEAFPRCYLDSLGEIKRRVTMK